MTSHHKPPPRLCQRLQPGSVSGQSDISLMSLCTASQGLVSESAVSNSSLSWRSHVVELYDPTINKESKSIHLDSLKLPTNRSNSPNQNQDCQITVKSAFRITWMPRPARPAIHRAGLLRRNVWLSQVSSSCWVQDAVSDVSDVDVFLKLSDIHTQYIYIY